MGLSVVRISQAEVDYKQAVQDNLCFDGPIEQQRPVER